MSYSEIVERLKTERETLGANEAEVRFLIVNELLKELGWDVFQTKQVRREVNVGAGDHGKNWRADFVLYGPSGSPWANIELKRLGMLERQAGLDAAREQAMQQAAKLGTELYVVCDGRYWEISDLARKSGLEGNRLVGVNLDEHEAVPKALAGLLGYEAVHVTGAAQAARKRSVEEYERRSRVESELPNLWRMLCTEPEEEIVVLLGLYAEERGLKPTEDELCAVIGAPWSGGREREPTLESREEVRGTPRTPARRGNRGLETPDEIFDRAMQAAPPKFGKAGEKVYRKRWEAFCEWQKANGRAPVPSTEENVDTWVHLRMEVTGTEPQSITHDLAAIRYVHKALTGKDKAGYGSPSRKTLRAYRQAPQENLTEQAREELEERIRAGYEASKDVWRQYWRGTKLIECSINGVRVRRAGWAGVVGEVAQQVYDRLGSAEALQGALKAGDTHFVVSEENVVKYAGGAADGIRFLEACVQCGVDEALKQVSIVYDRAGDERERMLWVESSRPGVWLAEVADDIE